MNFRPPCKEAQPPAAAAGTVATELGRIWGVEWKEKPLNFFLKKTVAQMGEKKFFFYFYKDIKRRRFRLKPQMPKRRRLGLCDPTRSNRWFAFLCNGSFITMVLPIFNYFTIKFFFVFNFTPQFVSLAIWSLKELCVLVGGDYFPFGPSMLLARSN